MFNLRAARLVVASVAVAVAALSPDAAASADELIDPRERAIPPLLQPADPSVPTPPAPQVAELYERLAVLTWADGTPEELPYAYEILVDGRVVHTQNPGNVDFEDQVTRVPFHSSGRVYPLEPGTTYTVGIRRLTPDFRRSAIATRTITTPGTRLPDALRPPQARLLGVRARATSATLDFEPGQQVEPYDRSVAGVDVKLPGREIKHGTTSLGNVWITGLHPKTTYRGEARTRNIAGDTSSWTPITFTTAAAPPNAPLPAPKPTVSQVTERSVLLSWAPIVDAFGEGTQPWFRLANGSEYPIGEFDDPKSQLPISQDDTGPGFDRGSTHRVVLWSVDKDGRRSAETTVTFTFAGGTQPTTPESTTPQPTTPQPTTPVATTPKPTAPVGETPESTTPDSETPKPSTREPVAGASPVLSAPKPLPAVAAGPTAAELRAAPLSWRATTGARGTTLAGQAKFARSVEGNGITVKVAVRSRDCRWWTFTSGRFARAATAARVARAGCVQPPHWRAIRSTWTGDLATFPVALGERLPAGRYAVRTRFQRGSSVLAERVTSVTVR